METNKLIDRLRELSKIGIVNYKHDTPVLIEAADRIEELEQRETVRHGHWILPDVCYEDIECSVCHVDMPLPVSFDYRPTYKYCPMCGAKMDEVTT